MMICQLRKKEDIFSLIYSLYEFWLGKDWLRLDWEVLGKDYNLDQLILFFLQLYNFYN